MKRSEFLGILAGIPFALTGKVKFGGEKTPEEIANHITITIKDRDGRKYRIKPSAFERVGSGEVLTFDQKTR